MRGLRNASVATSLTVTVGLMVGLIGLAQNIWDPQEPRSLQRFFGARKFELGGVFVTWHQARRRCSSVSRWRSSSTSLLNRTRTGIAMRAVVDDRNLVGMTGARPDRISMLSWAIGASMASVAGILLAPRASDGRRRPDLARHQWLRGRDGGTSAEPAADVRRRDGPRADRVVHDRLRQPERLADRSAFGALPTLFLFVVLLAMPEARLRAGRLVGAVTPRVPEFPAVADRGAGSSSRLPACSRRSCPRGTSSAPGKGLALAIIMLSLVLLTGYGGQVSLCQISFAGVGAYAMAKVGGDGAVFGILAAAGARGVRRRAHRAAVVTATGSVSRAEHDGVRRVHGLDVLPAGVGLREPRRARGRPPGARAISFNGVRAYFVLLAIVVLVIRHARAADPARPVRTRARGDARQPRGVRDARPQPDAHQARGVHDRGGDGRRRRRAVRRAEDDRPAARTS